MASPDPLVAERQYYLDKLGLNDNGNYSIAELRSMTGGGASVKDAAEPNKALFRSNLNVLAAGVGVTGDGVTDDTAAIMRAVEKSSVFGLNLFFPKGDYLIPNGLSNLPSGLTIRGDGPRTTTFRVTNSNVHGLDFVGTSAAVTKVQILVSDLSIVGPGQGVGGTGAGIHIKWTSVDFVAERLWIRAFGSHGIFMEDSYSASFVRCLLDSNGGNGFHGVTNINNITFDRCIAIFNQIGYSVIGGTSCLFLNADAESNQKAGFDLRYVVVAMLMTCHMEKNGLDGTSPNIYLHFRTGLGEKTTSANIIGCVIQGQGTTVDGLTIDGASRTNVSLNWFANHTGFHWKTTANADRSWIGPNTYSGTGTESQDLSASTVRMDYDATNLCARTDVLRLIPRAVNPAALAQGQLWWATATDQFRARNAANVVTVITGYGGTATLDFPSIAAGAIATLTIAVANAAVGDSVALGPPATIDAGLMWCGYVSAAGIVTVRLFNTTAAPIDPGSAGWKVNVERSAV